MRQKIVPEHIGFKMLLFDYLLNKRLSKEITNSTRKI